MIYLSSETLSNLPISTREIIEYLEMMIEGQVSGNVRAAPKSAIETEDGRFIMSTMATSDEPPFMAVKSLVMNPQNPTQGLDAINASITLLNSQTGTPLAVLDGNWITAIRTAAASAVAATRMANPESTVIAFIGCGVQAQSHLQIFSELFPLQEIRAFGRGQKNIDALCQNAEARGYTAIQCTDAREAIETADIIVSSIPLTAKVEPFLDARCLKPGAFISSTDLAIPWQAESLTALDQIVIDDFKQEAAMPKPMVDIEQVSGDITGLVTGAIVKPTVENPRTAFIFRAVPLGDMGLSALAYQKAIATDAGSLIE